MPNYLDILKQANEMYAKKEYIDALHLYRQLVTISNMQLDSIHLNIYFCLKNLSFFQTDSLKKIVVYTCNFGNYETVKELIFQDPTIEYILFTDNKHLKSETWRVQVIDDKDIHHLSARQKSRLPKILSHKYLPEHDYSLYLDSSLQVRTADIRFLLSQMLNENDIALYKHYKRNCVYDEINHVRASQGNDRQERDDICDNAIQMYEKIRYPKNFGLFENAVIARKNNQSVISLNNEWWKLYSQSSERDQFTFMRALYTTNAKVGAITLGEEFRKSLFLNFYRHNDTKQSNKIAIVVHSFYLDVWWNIYDRINALNIKSYDLFITGQKHELSIIKERLGENKNIHYLECDNLGMDILPFTKAVHHFKLHEYDAVLKLQTKNIKTVERKVQGDMIFDALLNKDVVNFIENNIHSESWSAIYPGLYARSLEALMYLNTDKVNQINNLLGLRFDSDTTFSAGTMFWSQGKTLKALYDSFYSLEELFQNSNELVVTGGDGSLAHALERVFGCLGDENKKLFSFRIGLNDSNYELFERDDFGKLFIDVLISDSKRFIDSYRHLQSAKDLSRSNFFDKKYYLEELRKIDHNLYLFASKSPAMHAILYNDIHCCDLSKNFSYLFYKVNNIDLYRKNKSILVHYLKFGKKEGRKIYPSYCDFYKMLYNFQLLDETKFVINIIDNNTANTNLPNDLYLQAKDYMKRAVIALEWDDFLFRKIVLGGGNSKINNDLSHRNLIEKRAFLYLLNGAFDEAMYWYNMLWKGIEQKIFSPFSMGKKLSYNQANNINPVIFNEVKPNENEVFQKIDRKICIYTTLYGDRDELPVINTRTDGIDYICFSDRLHDNSDWEVVIVPPEFFDNNLDAKRFKVLPHRYLSKYDASLFVDANTFLFGNLDELFKVYLLNEEFVMWKHPERSDVAWEVATIIAHRRHRPLEIINQLECYVQEGMPTNVGIAEGSFIWRVHNNNMLNLFMDQWWEHINRFSKRDQLSLSYLMWKNNFRPKVLPDYLGNGRKNVYFNKFSHKDVLHINHKKYNKLSRLAFVYSERFQNSGSTVMRGFQLFDIIKSSSLKNLISNISIESNFSNLENTLLFLTKGVLAEMDVEKLKLLKSKNNIIFADYVDAKVDKDLVDYIDVMVAASITAYIDYNTRFPNKKICLLTHHVDPRIENASIKHDKRNKIAYFGERVNTKISDEGEQFVDLYQVDTSGKDMLHSWINQVSKYRYHYAVRNKRGIDGSKPFTKGFTAACVDSPIILERDVDDAMYYLGYHYPYFLEYKDESIAEKLKKIITHQTVNGNSDYERASIYMQHLRSRSTPEFIANEFLRAIKEFI